MYANLNEVVNIQIGKKLFKVP